MQKQDHVGIFTKMENVMNQVLWKAAGYSQNDLERPIIGIANSFSDMVAATPSCGMWPSRSNMASIVRAVRQLSSAPLPAATASPTDTTATTMSFPP